MRALGMDVYNKEEETAGRSGWSGMRGHKAGPRRPWLSNMFLVKHTRLSMTELGLADALSRGVVMIIAVRYG